MAGMHRIAIVCQPGIRAFDLAVITEVWGPDRSRAGVPHFELRRCALDTGPIALPGGLTLAPDRDLDWLARADLVVVPALSEPTDPTPEPVLAALREAHARGVPVASLCAGAFILAEAGLLEGRRAVTHWWLAPRLAERHPGVLVEDAPLFVEDSGIWTSAGVASGIDLCLHLVREAHGSEVAAAIARSMVTGPFRTGDHAQYLDRPTPRRTVPPRRSRPCGNGPCAICTSPLTWPHWPVGPACRPAPSPGTSRPGRARPRTSGSCATAWTRPANCWNAPTIRWRRWPAGPGSPAR